MELRGRMVEVEEEDLDTHLMVEPQGRELQEPPFQEDQEVVVRMVERVEMQSRTEVLEAMGLSKRAFL